METVKKYKPRGRKKGQKVGPILHRGESFIEPSIPNISKYSPLDEGQIIKVVSGTRDMEPDKNGNLRKVYKNYKVKVIHEYSRYYSLEDVSIGIKTSINKIDIFTGFRKTTKGSYIKLNDELH